MDRRSKEVLAFAKAVTSKLAPAIEKGLATLEDAGRYCGASTYAVQCWAQGRSTPTVYEALLLRGYLITIGHLADARPEPGDIRAAITRALALKLITVEEVCTLLNRNVGTVLNRWIPGKNTPIGGLEKIRLESLLWEKGWMEPTYVNELDEDVAKLAWAVAKGRLTPEQICSAFGIEFSSLVRWFSGGAKPNKALRQRVSDLATRTRVPAMPSENGKVSIDDLAAAIKTINQIGPALLGGSVVNRDRLRRAHGNELFDASNHLARLCSESSRRDRGFTTVLQPSDEEGA